MSKILAVMIAGLFAAGAYAQTTSQEAAPPTNSKPQQRAEMKKDAKPAGQVKAMGGDTAKTPEGSGGLTSGKSVDAGAARQATRDERRRNKDGSVKKKSMQGGTPQ
ncbi:MAG: cell envelope biogenesis protein TolA [Variovorax sp.]